MKHVNFSLRSGDSFSKCFVSANQLLLINSWRSLVTWSPRRKRKFLDLIRFFVFPFFFRKNSDQSPLRRKFKWKCVPRRNLFNVLLLNKNWNFSIRYLFRMVFVFFLLRHILFLSPCNLFLFFSEHVRDGNLICKLILIFSLFIFRWFRHISEAADAYKHKDSFGRNRRVDPTASLPQSPPDTEAAYESPEKTKEWATNRCCYYYYY